MHNNHFLTHLLDLSPLYPHNLLIFTISYKKKLYLCAGICNSKMAGFIGKKIASILFILNDNDVLQLRNTILIISFLLQMPLTLQLVPLFDPGGWNISDWNVQTTKKVILTPDPGWLRHLCVVKVLVKSLLDLLD